MEYFSGLVAFAFISFVAKSGLSDKEIYGVLAIVVLLATWYSLRNWQNSWEYKDMMERQQEKLMKRGRFLKAIGVLKKTQK